MQRPDGLAARLALVRERIARAASRAGRDPADVRLVAVTKTVTADRIIAALDAGITDIGENRVQEAVAKRELVPDGPAWHLIGHLQTNKAAAAASLFDAIHSIDSARVAQALARHRPDDAGPMAALLEVDFTHERTRSGVSPEATEDLLRATAGVPGVHVLGLMTIAPRGDAGVARAAFVRLRELRDRLEQSTGWALPQLSMGMSGDFEVAVEEGATMVRLGTALFGSRD